jgi:hypothetical protein
MNRFIWITMFCSKCKDFTRYIVFYNLSLSSIVSTNKWDGGIEQNSNDAPSNQITKGDRHFFTISIHLPLPPSEYSHEEYLVETLRP